MTVREQRTVAAFGLLVRVVHSIAQDGARALRGHGLTPAQYQLLARVAARPGATQQQLCDDLGVTKGNVSMLVDRLEGAGLVLRVPAGAARDVQVTPAGRDLLSVLRPEHAAFLTGRFADLTDADLDDLDRILARLDPGP